jgi:hypothetical protein|tara:strand:+ start:395 stop:634 length:240 start_codon:yes stop_codon:yes gene_type:complete
MIKNINYILENNDISVRIGSNWYVLDEIGPIEEDTFPILVSDEDGGEHEFEMADIDDFDPMFKIFKDMQLDDNMLVGFA